MNKERKKQMWNVDKNEIFEMNKGNIYQVSPSSSLPRQQMCVYVCGIFVRFAYCIFAHDLWADKKKIAFRIRIFCIHYTVYI